MKTTIKLAIAAVLGLGIHAMTPALAAEAAQAPKPIHCTVMADAATGKRLVQDGQCAERVTPASTFKVAISLMGYDSGILVDEHTPTMPFKKGYVDWRPNWRTAVDPTSWIRDSVVWYSQQITTQLGEERFKRYLKQFDYGNQDVSGEPGEHNGLTYSWLGSSLKISPDEQVAFLGKLVNRKLAVSENAYAMTYRITQLAPLANGWEIHGKTGNASGYGWFIGWATKGQRTIVFARLLQDLKKEEVSPGFRARDALLQELPAQLESLEP
jgi:beta-lactamase class D